MYLHTYVIQTAIYIVTHISSTYAFMYMFLCAYVYIVVVCKVAFRVKMSLALTLSVGKLSDFFAYHTKLQTVATSYCWPQTSSQPHSIAT